MHTSEAGKPHTPPPSSSSTSVLLLLALGVVVFHVLTSLCQQHVFHLPNFSNVLLLSFGETVMTAMLTGGQLCVEYYLRRRGEAGLQRTDSPLQDRSLKEACPPSSASLVESNLSFHVDISEVPPRQEGELKGGGSRHTGLAKGHRRASPPSPMVSGAIAVNNTAPRSVCGVLKDIFHPSTVSMRVYVAIALFMSLSLFLTNRTSFLLTYSLQVIFKSSKLLFMILVRRYWPISEVDAYEGEGRGEGARGWRWNDNAQRLKRFAAYPLLCCSYMFPFSTSRSSISSNGSTTRSHEGANVRSNGSFFSAGGGGKGLPRDATTEDQQASLLRIVQDRVDSARLGGGTPADNGALKVPLATNVTVSRRPASKSEVEAQKDKSHRHGDTPPGGGGGCGNNSRRLWMMSALRSSLSHVSRFYKDERELLSCATVVVGLIFFTVAVSNERSHHRAVAVVVAGPVTASEDKRQRGLAYPFLGYRPGGTNGGDAIAVGGGFAVAVGFDDDFIAPFLAADEEAEDVALADMEDAVLAATVAAADTVPFRTVEPLARRRRRPRNDASQPSDDVADNTSTTTTTTGEATPSTASTPPSSSSSTFTSSVSSLLSLSTVIIGISGVAFSNLLDACLYMFEEVFCFGQKPPTTTAAAAGGGGRGRADARKEEESDALSHSTKARQQQQHTRRSTPGPRGSVVEANLRNNEGGDDEVAERKTVGENPVGWGSAVDTALCLPAPDSSGDFILQLSFACEGEGEKHDGRATDNSGTRAPAQLAEAWHPPLHPRHYYPPPPQQQQQQGPCEGRQQSRRRYASNAEVMFFPSVFGTVVYLVAFVFQYGVSLPFSFPSSSCFPSSHPPSPSSSPSTLPRAAVTTSTGTTIAASEFSTGFTPTPTPSAGTAASVQHTGAATYASASSLHTAASATARGLSSSSPPKTDSHVFTAYGEFTVLVVLAACSSLVGTLCLLRIIREYNSTTAVLVTSVRKTVTILCSYLLYGRQFTLQHALGLAGVMGGVYWYEMLRREQHGKKRKKEGEGAGR